MLLAMGMSVFPPHVLWCTGLSGAGKTTCADIAAECMRASGASVVVIDGDERRTQDRPQLGYSLADRRANVEQLQREALAAFHAGHSVVVAAIAPERAVREQLCAQLPAGRWWEIYLATPLSVCVQRDGKGLYARARAGEIRHMVGVDLLYEVPLYPTMTMDTSVLNRAQMREILQAAVRAAITSGPGLDLAP